MKLVSFNVNGIRARFHQLEALIANHSPDVIGLQEIKVADESFPMADLEKFGYHCEYFGQKGHYGVALMSKTPPVSIIKGYPSDSQDDQKRMITGTYDIDGKRIHVLNGYFPQGESRAHETKFPAKQKFYADLMSYLNSDFTPEDNIVVMGDFNISPEDTDIGIGDVNRKRWIRTGKCSFLPEEREWYQKLLAWGLTDTYRAVHGDSTELFSWFDYRSKGFDDDPKRGLRIDHILATAPLLRDIHSAEILYDIRAMEKPSDHCPVATEFNQ